MLSRRRQLSVTITSVISLVLCLFAEGARTQTEALRRVTRTPAEALNINPSISGDGRLIAFESNAPLADSQSSGPLSLLGFDTHALDASFVSLAPSRAPAPALSQDGTRAVFASKDDPVGRNRDGNSEIFFYAPGGLKQLTDTRPDNPSQRASQGAY